MALQCTGVANPHHMLVIPTYYTNAFFLSSVWKKEGVVLPTPYNAKSTKIKLLWFRTSLNNNQIKTELRLEHQTAGCFRNEFFQEAYSIFYARSDLHHIARRVPPCKVDIYDEKSRDHFNFKNMQTFFGSHLVWKGNLEEKSTIINACWIIMLFNCRWLRWLIEL